MLVIRQEQMQALRDARKSDYRRRLRSYLRAEFPDAVEHLRDDEIERYIDSAMEAAQIYRITSSDGVFLCAALAVLSGGAVFGATAVQRFLRLPYPDAEAKMRWLAARVYRELDSETARCS